MTDSIFNLIDTAPLSVRKHIYSKRYPARTTIISPGKPTASCLYIICEGKADVHKESTDGNTIVVNTFSAGDVFGEVEIFAPDCKPYTVETKTNCRILLLNKETVFHWMKDSFQFDLFLCELLTRRMYITSDSMSRIALLPIKERVLGCIWTYYNNGALNSLTKEELVKQVRAPLRSINRVVRICKEENLIDYRKKKFSVEDASRLKNYAAPYDI